ncbi:MAG: hypothetical protein A3F46_10225 [Legionellales bacterium RIFCSPHIGHO2_12_FULL_42_9]|nr:MAG: hypothetical protein A3F46_10225 [Legionellales bacterium RIFCSPHIGHO2_12_FULL_42_9]
MFEFGDQKGAIFNLNNASCYSYLGWLFFLNAVFTKPLSDLLMVLAVTFANIPGHRYITISLGLPNLIAVFCGVVVIVISWVMSEATKLQDGQRFII